MKPFNIYLFGLLLFCAPLKGITNTEDTKFWLWGILLPVFDKEIITCGTLVRKGQHGLITESLHLHRANFEQYLDNFDQKGKNLKIDNICGDLTMVSIGYCYFIHTKRDIHPFLGISLARATCSFSFCGLDLGDEWTQLEQPLVFWCNPSIKPSIGVHIGQNYWVSLLIQAEGLINLVRWPQQLTDFIDSINRVNPETLQTLPSYTFSKSLTIALAFKLF